MNPLLLVTSVGNRQLGGSPSGNYFGDSNEQHRSVGFSQTEDFYRKSDPGTLKPVSKQMIL